MSEAVVVGGGLAGSEAAWQIARLGGKVLLYEMRPKKQTPAHQTGELAELVCSNSLGSNLLESGGGILKQEMREIHSLVVSAADSAQVPAGSALAVDRHQFSKVIGETVRNHPNIRVINQELRELPENIPTIIATGPLTSDPLAESIKEFFAADSLYFFDAISPIVSADSIDLDKVFRASRYDKGDRDYLNCPLDKEEYERLVKELVQARRAPRRDFDKTPYFEGCMPVEEIASRGEKTLAFGPLKPVGLIDPKTGKRPYAVVQLRQEDKNGQSCNLVGFQTSLTYGEQKRVFRMIPGLEQAEFLRLGSMHRNTFINAPALLRNTLETRKRPGLFFAGQLSGVEGYMESTAMGLVAGINAWRLMEGKKTVTLPATTAIGALLQYISGCQAKRFQPMNLNFGIFAPLEKKIKDKKERRQLISQRALKEISLWRDFLYTA